jgi:hypothetical protein
MTRDSMMNDLLSVHVQIEIQERGSAWHVKGCTAYASNGMMRPIAIPPHQFFSRTAAIQAMKRQAREDLLPILSLLTGHIRWQLVLWFPGRPRNHRGHANGPPSLNELTVKV